MINNSVGAEVINISVGEEVIKILANVTFAVGEKDGENVVTRSCEGASVVEIVCFAVEVFAGEVAAESS